jgi:probable F420-dependent oxidoreductase
MFEELGAFGVWRSARDLSPEFAAAVEGFGYGAIWIGGSPGGDLKIVEDLLDATESLSVATGITNIWQDEPEPIAAAYHRIEAKHPGRFLLGMGVGHPEATGERYAKPYTALVEYLDALDSAGVPKQRRALAALGPRVLRLAAARSAGAHPYLTTPEHTRRARALMGPAALLAPEQKVVLDTDAVRARELGRSVIANPYLRLVNYRSNLKSLGYSDAELDDGGSDAVIDALANHGDATSVAAALRRHIDAGANHVAVQLLTETGQDPLPGLQQLAALLIG